MKPIQKFSFFFLLIVILAIIIQFSCSKNIPKDEQETILARVGDKTISVNEFLRRAEYTIRPEYCKLDNYVHKKIILNSLIAEKLLAIEDAKQSQLLESENFRAYIEGLQEQGMRQWMYHKKAYEKVKLDDEAVKKRFFLAGRTYNVAHFSLTNEEKASELIQMIRAGNVTFEDAFKEISDTDTLFTKKVAWKDQENTPIHSALFNEELAQNQIVGPVRISDDQFMLLKVQGWVDRKVITDTDIQRRYDEVTKYMTDASAAQLWHEYTQQVMKGKTVEFDRETFEQIFELLSPLYFKTQQEIKNSFSEKVWHDRDISPEVPNIEDPNFINKPFFKIDGETWTVGNFTRALRYHPLVFRKHGFPKKEFAEQLKLAIVDMIKDHYVNQEGYKEAVDEISVVKRNTNMWQDSYLAIEARENFLKSRGVKENFAKEYQNIIRKHLNAWVDSLQTEYSNQIEINMDAFEKCELTHIDLFVQYKSSPFPVVVPGFPVLTDDTNLDYGKLMK